ncbi:MAG: DUF2085 domain-containing protein [Bacteroidetes bacterium]|nr:DUF2085 domain-containing protein [Bacteroidota bacterium]
METFYEVIFTFFGNICAQNPERSLHAFNYQFPICYRCLGVYGFLASGLLICALLHIRATRRRYKFSLSSSIFASALLFLDVVAVQNIIPNNLTRFLSGAFLGVSLSAFIWQCLVALLFTSTITKRHEIERRETWNV